MDNPEDPESWKKESLLVIEEIKPHVNFVELSIKLSMTNTGVFLNLTTLEAQKFCVELTSAGFRIVGNDHDINGGEAALNEHIFETSSTLLCSISPGYSTSFAALLTEKLNRLQSFNA